MSFGNMEISGVPHSSANYIGFQCGDATTYKQMTPSWKLGNFCSNTAYSGGVVASLVQTKIHKSTLVKPPADWQVDLASPYQGYQKTFEFTAYSANPSVSAYCHGLTGECFVTQIRQVTRPTQGKSGMQFTAQMNVWPANKLDSNSESIEDISKFTVMCEIYDSMMGSSVFSMEIKVNKIPGK
jgi:hypothetical protein